MTRAGGALMSAVRDAPKVPSDEPGEELMHRVFVYGTLKRGFPNHAMLADALFVGRARTVEAYPLVVQGPRFSPALLPEAGSGMRVSGELWDVDDAKFAELDELESLHLPTGYVRELIMVERPDASTERVWVYFKPRDRIQVIHTDPLADYQDSRYVPAVRRGR
jgi:gamma-glutamylaminecyclotransferase